MANPTTIKRVRDTLSESLPDLKIAERRTTRSALHNINFTGGIQQWANFEADILSSLSSYAWSQQAIDVVLSGANAINAPASEYVSVADEGGVQGRITERIGQVVGAALEFQQEQLLFGDFKGANPPYPGYPKIPDFVVKGPSGDSKLVGEAKVPWIEKHDLEHALEEYGNGNDFYLRHLLGQIAAYMQETDRKHAFLTTYEQTIFLRKVDVNRKWTMEYSPVIYHWAMGSSSTVSLRECFWNLALLSKSDTKFGLDSGTRAQTWTRRA
ncbi:hypothetical protein PENDEC_c022G03081 [Penicillium decumbens]|uniref:Uncharacterized protein n=1 Tax=Penicillium decumbens TaxID=69771 RepID=A0A1V6P1B3_PENDC|nr:hypothetical protein PENDEC_c022G03081 [Penicillium decumbens]